MLQSQPETIVVRNDKSNLGVSIRGCNDPIGWGQPSDRRTHPTAPYDFNWIIDFEGREMHSGNVEQEVSRLRPVLVFRTGCFGTKEISSRKFFAIKDSAVRDFGYVASVMQAVIALNRGEHVLIQWGSQTIEIPHCVEKIKLYNVRPKDFESMSQYYKRGSGSATGHLQDRHAPLGDDLQIYYDDLLKIGSMRDRFSFIPNLFKSAPPFAERNDPFICYGGGGSTWP
jgi:hypothetical protein